jgi:lysine N6-hydroxylase
MHSHGIAEPQLSLMAWRSARILNRALGRDQFDLTSTPAVIQWRSRQPGIPSRAEHVMLNYTEF